MDDSSVLVEADLLIQVQANQTKSDPVFDFCRLVYCTDKRKPEATEAEAAEAEGAASQSLASRASVSGDSLASG